MSTDRDNKVNVRDAVFEYMKSNESSTLSEAVDALIQDKIFTEDDLRAIQRAEDSTERNTTAG